MEKVRRKIINGEDIQKVIFSPDWLKTFNVATNPHFIRTLIKLLHDDIFKAKWEILQTWSMLKEDEERIRFFRVHSFLRSSELKRQLEKFSEAVGCSNGFAEELFMKGKVVAHANETCSADNGIIEKALDALFHYKENLRFLSKWDIALYGNGLHKSANVKKFTDHLNSVTGQAVPPPVMEIFKTSDLAKRENRKLELEKQRKEVSKKKGPLASFAKRVLRTVMEDDFSFIWPEDSALVLDDREKGSPVIYVRLDLRELDKILLPKIKQLIKTKQSAAKPKKKVNMRIQFQSWEVALKLHDLNRYGFTEADLLFFIQRIRSKQDKVNRSFVSDNLALADLLIRNAEGSPFLTQPQ